MNFVKQENVNFSLKNFWSSINLWIENPHLVNRHLMGSYNFFTSQVIFKESVYNSESVTFLELIENLDLNENSIHHKIIESLYNLNIFKEINVNEEFRSGISLCFSILLSKNIDNDKIIECYIIDKLKNIVYFIPLKKKNKQKRIAYSFQMMEDKLNLLVQNIDLENVSIKWLKEKLFNKIIKWANDNDKITIFRSLSQIDVKNYNLLYLNLKTKYAKKIINIWTENTDPLKFVYEDLAIATYLITLWEKEYVGKQLTKKQSFVDLGCGNGLLVYILNEEGYEGYGIDVRKRKIWDLYPKNVKLKEESIIPSNKYLFSNVDWVIGNHSDELTVWIPVIAARSSSTCNFFLLPCCAYEFNGKKYQRKNCQKSIYNDFLEYVKEISEVCGFHVLIDKLRIPSTKRICIIGMERKFSENNSDEKIQNYIDKKSLNEQIKNDCTVWSEQFQPRANVESVRNCTKLNRDLVASIVQEVFNHLIVAKNMRQINKKWWNCGRKVSVGDIVKLFPHDILKQLKNECGGLQTLLKNHHYIFNVKNGFVELKIPLEANEKLMNKGKMNCWFFNNHPDACPLDKDNCRYNHNL